MWGSVLVARLSSESPQQPPHYLGQDLVARIDHGRTDCEIFRFSQRSETRNPFLATPTRFKRYSFHVQTYYPLLFSHDGNVFTEHFGTHFVEGRIRGRRKELPSRGVLQREVSGRRYGRRRRAKADNSDGRGQVER